MKKHLSLSVIILALGVFLFAQEKIEVSMKVTKNGKLVKDTTYTFDDAKKAKHAVHMFDAMATGDHHMEFIHKEGNEMKHHKKMDKDEHGHVVVSSGDEDGNVTVIVKEFNEGECEGGKKVIKKEIIIIGGEDDEDGTWTIKKGKNGEEVKWKKIEGDDGEVIIIKKIKGEGDEEEINVEVITKEKKAVKKEVLKKEKKKSKK